MCELITIAERSTIFDNNSVAHHRFPPSLIKNCCAVVVVVVISTVSPEKHTVPKQSDVSSDIVLHAEDHGPGLDTKHLYPEPHSLHTSAVVVVVVVVVVAASKLAPSEHTVPVQSDVLSSI